MASLRARGGSGWLLFYWLLAGDGHSGWSGPLWLASPAQEGFGARICAVGGGELVCEAAQVQRDRALRYIILSWTLSTSMDPVQQRLRCNLYKAL